MNVEQVREGLNKSTDYKEVDIANYVGYLHKLLTEKNKEGGNQNYWLHNNSINESQLIDVFKKVGKDGLFIDGDIITLSYRKKLIVDYSYQAYRKKLLMMHPETLFDAQVVYKGDEFHFEKQSGEVVYTHEFTKPFEQTDKNIIGAYCIVKNKQGEFIELLSTAEAMKMKEVAKTKMVWNKWESRMYLKSVIKRLCKTFFYDSFVNVEQLDNENYDLSQVGLTEAQKEAISNKIELKKIKGMFQTEFKKYNGDDKDALRTAWVEKHKANDLTIEFIKPVLNYIQYSNLLDTYSGHNKEILIDAFKSTDVVSDEMLINLKELING